MTTALLVALTVLCLALLALAILLLLRLSRMSREADERAEFLRHALAEGVPEAVKPLADLMAQNLQYAAQLQAQRLDALQRQLAAQAGQTEERLRTFAVENEQKLDGIRQTVERRLAAMQQEQGQRLGEMRRMVDERLQKSLEERMTRSFGAVSERLEQVYRGLGEMHTLAAGVGDLKKVLSNVKTRGILGEIQLGAILEEILAPEQYAANVAVTPGSRNVVEFAVRLPAGEDGHVWLPIDAKFPGDAYAALRDAQDAGRPEDVKAAWAALQQRLRGEAKDIRDKYVNPPHTTDFAVLFLPFEGLYAEAVNHGMVEMLQRDFRVSITGPSTMAALLNSLQMGFRAFALQKRSGEVWKTLSAVKAEFDRFADVLAQTRQRLDQAGSELDRLVGVRTRQIQKALGGLSALSPEDAALPLPDPEPVPPGALPPDAAPAEREGAGTRFLQDVN